MSTYENTVRTQIDGWPVGVTEIEKAALTAAAKRLLTESGPVPLHIARQILATVGRVPEWKRPAMLDYQYATVERALRAAGGEQVWRLESQ